jgi:hypothetical protein
VFDFSEVRTIHTSGNPNSTLTRISTMCFDALEPILLGVQRRRRRLAGWGKPELDVTCASDNT